MKDFINRHGHLSMWVILILLVIAFFMSRNFLLWSTYQKTMDAFAEFPEQENNNIFITAQVDMVKIVTKTAEIDINDYPELYEMLAGFGCFYRCGRSYILNLDHIKKVTASSVMLQNGMELPVPRSTVAALRSAFFNHFN